MSGDGVVLQDSRRITLTPNKVEVELDKKLSLVYGQLGLYWNNIETIFINGSLNFSAANMFIKIQSGEANMRFTPSATGYIIATERINLKITGTVIDVKITEDSDCISIIQGQVEWALHDKTRTGKAAAGVKIVIQEAGSGSLSVREERFSGETSPESNSYLKPIDSSIKIINSGKGWESPGTNSSELEEH
jgi:hypothetical protein